MTFPRGTAPMRVTKFNPNAPWRKHGTDRAQRIDPQLALLDSIPRPVTTYRGVIVRRKVG